jgi:hypothetical protein
MLKQLRRMAPDLTIDAIAIAGGGLVVYGVALIYSQAAYILAGIGLVALAAIWNGR